MNERIKELLARPGLERLNDWASIGPVQRAALEEFAELIDTKQEWQGLTGEELRNIAREFKGNTQRRFEDHWDEIVAFIREAEAKLKEKNA
jgi:hypothetical protein